MAKTTKTTKTPKTVTNTNGSNGTNTQTTQPLKPLAASPESTKPVLAAAAPLKAPGATLQPAKVAQPTVSLEFVNPAAKQVAVAGSFNDWKPERTPLARIGNGRWVGDLSVKPGRHEYLFVVDGQWLPDPNAKENVQNPFGGKNSVLIVSA